MLSRNDDSDSYPLGIFIISSSTQKQYITYCLPCQTSGSKKDKVKEYLVALGVDIDELRGGRYNKNQVEDICDALGMALGTIHEHIIT